MPATPLLGSVIPWAPDFAPRGWAFCDGQLLAISSNDALFSILGTIYGGDGRTTFGLPDLRGRMAIHAGSGPGLTTVRLGEKSGAENASISVAQLSAHSHPVTTETLDIVVSPGGADQALPSADHRLADAKLTTGQDVNLYSSQAPDTTLEG